MGIAQLDALQKSVPNEERGGRSGRGKNLDFFLLIFFHMEGTGVYPQNEKSLRRSRI